MDDRIALLTGVVAGALLRAVADGGAFTYRSVQVEYDDAGNYTNRVIVIADDLTRFTVTVDRDREDSNDWTESQLTEAWTPRSE